MRGFFFDILCKNLVEYKEVTLTKVGGPPITGSTRSFYFSDFSTLSHQQFVSWSSGFSAPALVPITNGFLFWEFVILCTLLPVFSILGAAVWPVTLHLQQI